MICKEVQNYLATAKGLPFFYIVGDDDYHIVLNDLLQSGITLIRMSDFCFKEDKFPSVDELIDYFRTSDIDYRNNKFVVVGIGEYLSFRGEKIVDKELCRLKSTTLGNARVILLLRGVSSQAIRIINDDNRMNEQQRAFICQSTSTDISIKNITKETGIDTIKGFKNLLYHIEDGVHGEIQTNTALYLNDSLFPISIYSSTFSVIKILTKNQELKEEFGTEEQWEHFFSDLSKCDTSLSKVFFEYSIKEFIRNDFYLAISGCEYKNWLVFLYYKLNLNKVENYYLKLVIEKTNSFDDFKTQLLNTITEYSHEDKMFRQLYDERKILLKNFPEEDIAIFMKANEIDDDESIYRYTDNTLLEKKTIVKWIVAHGINDAIEYVYPALNDYLQKYIFDCPVLTEELTEYFNAYKKQKILNCITDEFMLLVEHHAKHYSYAKLPTRNNAIKSIKDKKNTYLFWIDALGVEYLSYIQALAKKKGLSIHIDIARSDLPTITDENKQFFENWTGKKKYKEETLDNIKHKEKGGYFFTDDEDPIHIPAELEVIEKAIATAAMELTMHNCKSFVIASDHGASRLAVIKKQEIKYDTETQGKHSGRCCHSFPNCEVQYKFDENGYISLSDYGRFRGSRRANVEVHGGASLEEIVVPIITLTLKKQGDVQIKVLKPNNIIANRRNGVTLTLYISDIDFDNNVSINIENKKYHGTALDNQHFEFKLTDIKRARKEPYPVEVFDGDDLIGSTNFKIKSKAATVDDDFEDAF